MALLESLAVEDLERLAVSAYLVGIDSVSDDAWTRAHQTRLGSGDVPGAVRCAFWLAFRLVNAFDRPEGNGWIARIERLVEPASPDSIEAGRLAYLTGLRAAFEADLNTAATDLARSAEIASLCLDDELAALTRLSLGRVRISWARSLPASDCSTRRCSSYGRRRCRPSPSATATALRSTRATTSSTYSVVRPGPRDSRTGAPNNPTSCPSQASARSTVRSSSSSKGPGLRRWPRLAWHGLAWSSRSGSCRTAVRSPARRAAPPAGRVQRSDACYREASSAGRDPQPGLALLRLRQRRREDAAQAIDRALAEAEDPIGRAWLLDAYVEIMLANDRVVDATSGATELAAVASGLSSPMLYAVARRARGAVRLAEDDPRGALGDLRKASDGFRDWPPPEAARCAVLIGRARRSLGDDEGARLETDQARATFDRPGPAGFGGARGRSAGRNSRRGSNRCYGWWRPVTPTGPSVQSSACERTVDRHLSNIFTNWASPRALRRQRWPTSPTCSDGGSTSAPKRSWVTSPMPRSSPSSNVATSAEGGIDAQRVTANGRRVMRMFGLKARLSNLEGGITVSFQTHTSDEDLGPLLKGCPTTNASGSGSGMWSEASQSSASGDESRPTTPGTPTVPPGHVPIHHDGAEVVELARRTGWARRWHSDANIHRGRRPLVTEGDQR